MISPMLSSTVASPVSASRPPLAQSTLLSATLDTSTSVRGTPSTSLLGDEFKLSFDLPALATSFVSEAETAQSLQAKLKLNSEYADGLKSVVSEKLSLAGTTLYKDDPVAMVRILKSAFADIEAHITALEKGFSGDIPPEIQALIAKLRALQSTVMQRLKTAMGIDVSDEELSAALRNDPKLKSDNKDARPVSAQDNALLQSLAQKLGPKLSTINTQASALISQARGNPAQAAALITQAMGLLAQGMQIVMVGGAFGQQLGGNGSATPQAAGGNATAGFGQEQASLMQLLQEATLIAKQLNIPAQFAVSSPVLG